MQTGPFNVPTRSPWWMALIAAAGSAMAPAALAQDEDPIEGMLRSMAQGLTGSGDPEAAEGSYDRGERLSDDELIAALEDDVSVDENMIVELHVQDEDLANVLQMLSIQSQRNIVTSRNVSATVTANLYGVTFFEALDAILHVNGYGYVEQGNFIYVYTLEELGTIEEAARQRVARTIRLDFLNAVDAAEFVTPLLSEGGFIKTNGRAAEFNIPGENPTGAEDYANASMLVVFDYPENIEEIERLIDEIDSRPAQVLVEATIVQTTLNEANAFGVDFSIVGDLDIENFLNVGGPLGAVDALRSGVGAAQQGESLIPVAIPGDGQGQALQSTPGNTDGPSTLKLGIIDEDISVFVRMLDEVSDTTILSSPKILALNRQPSRVLVGRKVGYLSTTSTETSTTQTVEFLDTGTQLYFRPFVSNDGMIRMELKPQVSEAIIRNQTDATGAAVTIPDEITNEIVTNVLVPDGHTIVLGGLFRESTSAERRQVPILGDLPIVGAAFRGHDDSIQRQEIIFLIKPSILADDVLIDQGGRGEDYVRRIRAGSREGLLPWSRERQSSQLLVEAERLAAEGKVDRALHKVRRALEHNPFQPDAIAMRERLTNEQAQWPHRNLLQDVVENELFDAPAGHSPSGSMSRDAVPSGPVSRAPVGSVHQSTPASPINTPLSPTTVSNVSMDSGTSNAQGTELVPTQSAPAQTVVASEPVYQTTYASSHSTSDLQPTPVAARNETEQAAGFQSESIDPTPAQQAFVSTGSFVESAPEVETQATAEAPVIDLVATPAPAITEASPQVAVSPLDEFRASDPWGASSSKSLFNSRGASASAPSVAGDATLRPTGGSGLTSTSTPVQSQPQAEIPAATQPQAAVETQSVSHAQPQAGERSESANGQMRALSRFFAVFNRSEEPEGQVLTEVPTDTPE